MKYMLLIYSNEADWTDDERTRCMEESSQLCHRLESEGKYLAASPLHLVASATSVRVREGKPLVTAGPFAETHEQLGGYFLIDVESLEEATKIASQIPGAKKGTVEVRPIFELSSLPE